MVLRPYSTNRKGMSVRLIVTAIITICAASLTNEISEKPNERQSLSVSSVSTTKNLRHISRRQLGEKETEHKTASQGAIVILTTAFEKDIDNLCIALHSLQYLPGDRYVDDPASRAPVLVFNEGDLSELQMAYLKDCVADNHRTIAFPVIHLNDHYPVEFGNRLQLEWEAYKESVGLAHVKWEGRPPEFSYANMIRFWTFLMWKHPAVQQFETIMRMDTDSCFELEGLENNPDLQHVPFLPPEGGHVYHSFGPGLGVTRHFFDYDKRTFVGASVRKPIQDILNIPDCQRRAKDMRIQGLYEDWRDYAERRGVHTTYPGMFNATVDAYEQFCTLPTFATHFEVARRSFFEHPGVHDWHQHLSEEEPYGIFRKRWGDAQTRFLTMALFANETNLIVTDMENGGYEHGRDYSLPNKDFKCQLRYGEIVPNLFEWKRNQ